MKEEEAKALPDEQLLVAWKAMRAEERVALGHEVWLRVNGITDAKTAAAKKKGNGAAPALPEPAPPPPARALVVELPRAQPLPSVEDEAEQAVLGALMLDNAKLGEVRGIISATDFSQPHHRTIYQHVAALIDADKPADQLTVAESLGEVKLAAVGGHRYLGALAFNTPSSANVRGYALNVAEHSLGRDLAALGKRLADAALAPGADVAQLLGETRSRIEALAGEKDDWPRALDMAALAVSEPQPPLFIVPDVLPVGYATLMAGHGGVGKSAVALHLAVCIALGLTWAGLTCEPRRVLYLSCEDREGVLHWRLTRICRHLGVSLAELAGRLDIVELVGHDAILWERDPRTGGTITPAFARLKARVKRYATEVLIVDGITDTYAGIGGATTDVKRYVNALLALIAPERGAVLLIGHVNRPTAVNPQTTEGYGGVTTWHNAVRSRMYLYPESGEDEDGRRERSGRLLLELQKANLGPMDRTIAWRWDEEAHLFLPENAPTAFDRQHREREERRGILLALHGCARAAITVPAAMQGSRTAFHVLSARPEFPATLRSGKPAVRRFWAEIEKLRQIPYIEEREYRRANGHKGNQFALTTEGERHIAAL